MRTVVALVVALVVAVVALPALGAVASPLKQNVTLTLYNAQHVPLAEAWVSAFTQETGIKVEIRSGRDLELANLIVQEGSASPADVFITENSPAMSVVGQAGLFAPVDTETLALVPPQLSSASGDWVGIAARTTVFVHNPSLLPVSSVPASMLDLANPEWKDRFGIAPTGADFQAIVSAVLQLKGPEVTEAWLRGLKENAKVYTGNRAIMTAANKGEIEGGIIYHYYWYGDRAESGQNSGNVELYHWMGKDPGGFVSVSGGGVLKSSKNPAEAQKLLQYMASTAGQKILSDSNALEYAVGLGSPSHPSLKPLSELDPPVVDLSQLNAPLVIELMQKAGLL
ncbi:MAG: extracellular solute-binding protein [Chloroflexi bacterium]|nr:extracellular solute-binding protein [Chloroflexota bacterium]